MRELDIVYILNDKYWIPVLVSAKSAILCRDTASRRDCRLHFWLIVDDVLEEHRKRLCEELTTNVSAVNVIDVDLALFQDMPEWHGSKLVWTRCKINRLLPQLHGWTCICDGDTLWVKDPAELLAVVGGYGDHVICGGSIDFVSSDESSAQWFVDRGLSCPNSGYICLGFALLNMDRIRSFGFEQKSMSFLKQYGVPPWFEQDIFNYLLKGHIVGLPLGWGASPIRGVKNVNGDVAVLHYYGALPWPASCKRRMLDVHVPWWYLSVRLLHIPQEHGFRMSGWTWFIMRLMTYVLQAMPLHVLARIHRSAKQVPYDYRPVVRKYKLSADRGVSQ